MKRPVLFVTAVGWESQALMAAVGGESPRVEHGFRLWRAGSGDGGIWCLQTGIGPERARAAIAWAVSFVAPGAIVSTGCAGALRSDLDAGDLVIASRIHAAGALPIAPSEHGIGLYERAALAAGVRAAVGPLLTSPTVLSTPEAKRRAAEESACIAVDMEAAVLAGWAAERGVAFTAARVIIDSVSTVLPKGIVDAEGRVRPAWLARALLRQPGFLFRLPGLRAAMRRCDASLRAVHARVVAEIKDRGR